MYFKWLQTSNKRDQYTIIVLFIFRALFGLPYLLFRRDNFAGVSFFAYDVTFAFYNFFYQITWGYFIAVCFAQSSAVLTTDAEKGILGNLLSWVMTLAALVGALGSYVMAWLVENLV